MREDQHIRSYRGIAGQFRICGADVIVFGRVVKDVEAAVKRLEPTIKFDPYLCKPSVLIGESALDPIKEENV